MTTRIVSLAMLLTSGLAFAEAPAGAPPGPPKPTQQLKDFAKWFAGTYPTCTAKWSASPMGPAHPAKGTATVDWELDGMWLKTHYQEQNL